MSTQQAAELSAELGNSTPLLLALAEPVPAKSSANLPMTKYKTFSGEEIDGQKVWRYDFHDDEV